MIPIKYIGKRPEYTDGMYATRIHWKQGETMPVPDEIAVKMLRHIDVYTLGDEQDVDKAAIPVVETAAAAEDKNKTEDDAQNMRDSIAIMDKGALVNFAQTNFRVKLDNRASVSTLRQRVTGMVDQYGVE